MKIYVSKIEVKLVLERENKVTWQSTKWFVDEDYIREFAIVDDLTIRICVNFSFVNREIVGKGLSRPLITDDVITFVIPIGGFKFVAAHQNEETKDVECLLPDAITSKYIIGKLIGTGASCKHFILPSDLTCRRPT